MRSYTYIVGSGQALRVLTGEGVRRVSLDAAVDAGELEGLLLDALGHTLLRMMNRDLVGIL